MKHHFAHQNKHGYRKKAEGGETFFEIEDQQLESGKPAHEKEGAQQVGKEERDRDRQSHEHDEHGPANEEQ
jgi:hypothetical protein